MDGLTDPDAWAIAWAVFQFFWWVILGAALVRVLWGYLNRVLS